MLQACNSASWDRGANWKLNVAPTAANALRNRHAISTPKIAQEALAISEQNEYRNQRECYVQSWWDPVAYAMSHTHHHRYTSCGTLGMFLLIHFGPNLDFRWRFSSKRTRQKVRQIAGGDAGFLLIPNIGRFLPKSWLFACVSTIPGRGEQMYEHHPI